jgi:hypothetical protein
MSGVAQNNVNKTIEERCNAMLDDDIENLLVKKTLLTTQIYLLG